MNREIPESWVATTIDAVVKNTTQRVPDGAEKFIYIDISSINRDKKQIVSPQNLLGSDAPSRARKVVKTGDVLVSMTRPNMNAVALVTEDLNDQIASTGFDVLRSNEIDTRWLFYLVRTFDFVTAMSEKVQGALYPAISSKIVREYEIPLAPLNEQKRIANKLDILFSAIDACRTRFEKIPTLVKRFRQSVLADATSGALTENWRIREGKNGDAKLLHALLKRDHEDAGGHARGNAAAPTEKAHTLSTENLPNTWEIAELRDICMPGRPITYGILKPGPELEVGISYVRVADFPGNKLKISGIKKTSPEIDEQFRRARLTAGDLLLSIRGSVGRLIKIPIELNGANITQDTARLSISNRLCVDFVYLVLLSEAVQTRMKNATRGVAVRGINIGDVRALQIALPSLDEQHEIVRRVDALFAIADKLEASLATARKRVDQLTPAILAQAFRGELVEQDPVDEPASALLARIAAAGVRVTPRRTKRKAA